MATTEEKGKKVKLTVQANLLDVQGNEKMPQLSAYAFSSGGQLLSQKEIDREGKAILSFEGVREPNGVRVLVGPTIDDTNIENLLAELTRRGALLERLRIDPDKFEFSSKFDIFRPDWLCWLRSLCVVKGRLMKKIVTNGILVEYPVCHATVEIYEVDPIFLILPKIPKDILDKIRGHILNPPKFREEVRIPRIPIPDPPPDFRIGQMFAQSAEGELGTASEVAEMTTSFDASASSSSISDLQFIARSANDDLFRSALLKNLDFVRPIICLFYPFVVKQLVATATTDDCGKFTAIFFRGCNNPDTPDLYFKAKQKVLPYFPPFTIYAPTPVGCYTYWNYQCGTEVTLYTNSPWAITCAPCPPVIAPNNWVLFMAVGNHPLSLIRGTGTSLSGTTNNTNIGLTNGGAPWGGLLRPRIEFDNSLRQNLNVKYYKVMWRKVNAVSEIANPPMAATDWTELTPGDGDVYRHYAHMVGTTLVIDPYQLGPKTVNGISNLIEIPPAMPPLGQWSLPNVVEDTASAKFPTTVHAPAVQSGKYQLRLDLFDNNGAPVNIVAKGIKYVVPTSTDLTGTINTVDADIASLNLVHNNSMVITLHVDNNICTAEIAAPSLGGTFADDDCGVLEYDPNSPGSVQMDYTASHPNGFATRGFTVYRGANAVLSQSGPVGTGSFSVLGTVVNLLSVNSPGGGCCVAGFSENLSVDALATDGWSRQSQYDRDDVRAFVLTQPCDCKDIFGTQDRTK